MRASFFTFPFRLPAALLLPALLLTGMTGCKAHRAPGDAELTSSLNRALSQDGSIAGQPVMGSVQAGVATLTGNVSTDAQKVIAARDASSVAGVVSVVNNLAVAQPGTADPAVTGALSAPVAPMAPGPVSPQPAPASRSGRIPPRPAAALTPRTPAPIIRETQQAYLPPPSAPVTPQPPPQPPPPPPPPPPPRPVFRDVTLAAGTTLPVRMTQTLDSATTQTGDSFSGVLASDVLVNGAVALPAGTPVSGHVDAVQEAAHFKGNSLLTVSLSSVRARGSSESISTDPYSVQGKGRGKNTAVKAGGGAAVGAILGGIFGGGKGAAIGAAAGGGAGAGVNAVTRGEQVQIPSESVVRFQTSTPVTVRVRTEGGASENGGAGLQTRPNQ